MLLGQLASDPGAWGMYRLGFRSHRSASGRTGQTLPPIEEERAIYKINVAFSSGTEYLLAENRQQIGFDQGLRRMGPRAFRKYTRTTIKKVLEMVAHGNG
jgi:hypothetical protein